MDREHNTAGRPGTDDHDIRETLATIEDHTGQTLELVRTLISLLLPEPGREGPPLEELIARLIVQQREILTIVRRTQADVRALGDRLPKGDGPDQNGHAERNGAAGSC